jgi:hypothetical protein
MNLRPSLAASVLAAVVAVTVPASPATAHVPSVVAPGNESPETAFVLDDPTLSRAIGATLAEPGEVDWYRMDLRAGDPLVVEVTAPDAEGGIAISLALFGPGLPAPASDDDAALAARLGSEGVLRHEAAGGAREVHGGLGFIAWGGIRTTAPADGTFWIEVRAAESGATGKYVLAPGVREEFGPGAIVGMVDMVAFFNAPWPPAAPDSEGSGPGLGGAAVPSGGLSAGQVAGAAFAALGVAVLALGALSRWRASRAAHTDLDGAACEGPPPS